MFDILFDKLFDIFSHIMIFVCYFLLLIILSGVDSITSLSLKYHDLHSLLHDECHTPIQYNRTLQQVIRKGNEMELIFKNDAPTASRDTYDLIIGADGIHSTVRQQYFQNNPSN